MYAVRKATGKRHVGGARWEVTRTLSSGEVVVILSYLGQSKPAHQAYADWSNSGEAGEFVWPDAK
jgi:hypothetical protein